MTEDINRSKFHPTSIYGLDIPNIELGRLIAQMRYDQVSEVLRGISIELGNQAEGDTLRGRLQLAQLLRDARVIVDNANDVIGRMFRLSRPYMDHEFTE